MSQNNQKSPATTPTSAVGGVSGAAAAKIRKPRGTKEEIFRAKANKAVPQALKALSTITNLVDYNPSQEFREKIVNVITSEYQKLVDAYTTPVEEAEDVEASFSL